MIALDAYLPGELPDEPFDPENMPRKRAMIDECGRGWAAAVEAGKAAGMTQSVAGSERVAPSS